MSRAIAAILSLLATVEPSFADKGSCYTNSPANVAFGSLSVSALQNATAVGYTSQGCPGGLIPTTTMAFCSSIAE
jgi:hypothetical protein